MTKNSYWKKSLSRLGLRDFFVLQALKAFGQERIKLTTKTPKVWRRFGQERSDVPRRGERACGRANQMDTNYRQANYSVYF